MYIAAFTTFDAPPTTLMHILTPYIHTSTPPFFLGLSGFRFYSHSPLGEGIPVEHTPLPRYLRLSPHVASARAHLYHYLNLCPRPHPRPRGRLFPA